MLELRSTIAAVNNQTAEREAGCLSMRGERILADEIKRLRTALADARDALRNDFEPDNQSRAWHRANDALNLSEQPGG